MKKYAKYEKMPDGSRAKQPAVKSMLLQTYFTSLLCLVLCVTMFFGTSYAWFTSGVENEGNEIHIGILDVGLYKETAEGDKDLADSNNKLFDSSIRWEPGYTALETIKIANKGDLAFKYTLSFATGAVSGPNGSNKTLSEVAKFFDVWVFNHRNHAYQKPGSYDAIEKTEGWVNVGTLDQLLAGEPVIQGNMVTVRLDDLEEGTTASTVPGFVDAVATEDTYTIALHMNGNADDSVMGHKIQLNVKLVAYQKDSEHDSFGDDYDEAQYVTNDKELQEALNNAVDGAVIRFANDITGKVTVVQKPDVKFTIDGAGYKLTGSITVNGKSVGYETAGLTIKNINFIANNIELEASINMGVSGDNNTRYVSNLTVQDCTFAGDLANEKTAVKAYTGGDKNLTVIGCKATGMHTLVQVKNVAGLTIRDCEANGKNGISVGASTNVVISDCEITATGYGIRADGTAGGNLTLKDNSVNAQKQPVVVRKLTAAGYELKLQGTNALTTASDPSYQIVLTTGDDEAVYVQPNAEHYTIIGGEGFNIYK